MSQLPLCPHCLEPVRSGYHGSCPNCGKSLENHNPEGALPLGTQLGGHYTVGEYQSADGDGLCYRGVDNDERRFVLIKEYFPVTLCNGRSPDGDLMPKEGREVLFKTSRMDFKDLYDDLHRITPATGLSQILDVMEENNTVYAVEETEKGMTLTHYLKLRARTLTPVEARTLLQPVMEGVALLHKAGLIHRGICPDNILLPIDGAARLTGYGTLALRTAGSELKSQLYPGYAAPEQYTRPGASPDTIETVPLEETMPLRGYKDAFAYQNVRSNKGPSGRGVSNSVTAAQATNAGGYGTISKRTDVYGIGATLYYAITGQQPGHSLKDVRPITSYKLKFSRSFLLIIARAMMKRQEERFCDAQEMLRALQDIHAIDGRYKKVVHSQRVVAAVSLVLAVSGTLAILFGVQRIGVERYAAYDALVRKGRTAADEMRFDEAEQDLQQAIAIYDDQLEAYVEQAVLLYRQGKYQECIDAVETTQSRELKYYSRQSVANLYNVAAEAYYELESYESAATMYQKAIGYSPDILSYYQGEATALIQLGDYSGADEVLAEMAKAVPDAEQSGAYQVVQSELLRKQGDLPDALDAARKAIGSADGNDQLARAYRLAASICEDIGDSMLSEEINLLNQGIEQLPDGYYNALAGQLASAYIRQAEATGNPGYQKDALRTYQQLEKNGNTTLEVRLNIAMLQYQLHDFSKAMEMLQALKNDYPKDYRVYKWLAFVQGELDLQNGASYTKTLGYYETAAELYRAEQASGVYDPQMDELDRMARNNWQ